MCLYLFILYHAEVYITWQWRKFNLFCENKINIKDIYYKTLTLTVHSYEFKTHWKKYWASVKLLVLINRWYKRNQHQCYHLCELTHIFCRQLCLWGKLTRRLRSDGFSMIQLTLFNISDLEGDRAAAPSNQSAEQEGGSCHSHSLSGSVQRARGWVCWCCVSSC